MVPVFKNTWSCFEMFFKDLENILARVIVLAFYHILNGIVMTLNSFNFYSDDLRYLQVGHISNNSTCKVFFQVFTWRTKILQFCHMWTVLRARKTVIFSALQLLFWTWGCFDVMPRLFYFCPRHLKTIYKMLEFYQFQ